MGVVREVPIKSAVISNYEGMDALVGEDGRVYLGRRENYHSGIGEDIRACWNRPDRELLDKVAGARLYHQPTNSEFLDMTAAYLRRQTPKQTQ